jgi:hypothetical protein
VTFVGEASVDWTWSFPVVLATACAVVGAAAGPAAAQLPVRAAAASACAACVLAVLLFGPRVVAADAVDKARSLATSAPASAGARLDLARALDPWDPEAAAETGRLAEARGDYREAARRYARAAVLSQRPWLQHFRQARALAAAGASRASFVACRTAFRENPGEPDLHGGPCAGVR